MSESNEFTIVEPKSKPGRAAAGPKPPDALLEKVKDGQKVRGPDGVQWIAKPALPRRWAQVRVVTRKAKQS